jgi:hypothetical protein
VKANETENGKPDAPANELNESELEKASGGLWGITIWDLCYHEFNETKCMDAIGEHCPQLIVCNWKTTSDMSGNSQIEYVLTCRKGCFKGLKYLKSITY